MTRLASEGPVRRIKTNRRSLTGRVALLRGGTAEFESSLERDWIITLDFDSSVRLIREQPFSIHYRSGTSTRRYTPDVLAEFTRPRGEVQTVVYEVKPRADLWYEWKRLRPRFKAAVHFCRERGWRFKLVTENEIRTRYLANIVFLRRYAGLSETIISKQLLHTLKMLGPTTPQALLAASYWHEEYQMAAIPEMWRLVALGRIDILLHDPLTMISPIWLPD